MTTASPDGLLTLPSEFWDPDTAPFFDDEKQTWNVFNYEDVMRVLTDKDMFSQAYGDPDVHPNFAVMWCADDPRHKDLRTIASEPFRQSVLRELTPTIEAVLNDLIDEILAAGTDSFEMTSQLSYRLPNRVICHIMGVDMADDVRFAAWLKEAFSAATISGMPPQPDMVRYFSDLLEERRKNPQNGLVDELIAAQRSGYQVAGEPLSDRDLIGYLWGLLSAGTDTTSASIGNMFLFLTEYGNLDEVRDDRALVNSAVEETLRWYPAFPSNPAVALADVSFGDCTVSAGQTVTAWMSAANRDPSRFEDPNVFDIRRNPNRHLTFGWGSRHCLGAPLARLELRIALEVVRDRLPGLRWDKEKPFTRTLGIVNHIDEAHLVFDRASAGNR
jgi:cytochrome P450